MGLGRRPPSSVGTVALQRQPCESTVDVLDPVQFWAGIAGIAAAAAGAVVYVHRQVSTVTSGLYDLKLHAQKAREAAREMTRQDQSEAFRTAREENDRLYASAEGVAEMRADLRYVREAIARIERAVGVTSRS